LLKEEEEESKEITSILNRYKDYDKKTNHSVQWLSKTETKQKVMKSLRPYIKTMGEALTQYDSSDQHDIDKNKYS